MNLSDKTRIRILKGLVAVGIAGVLYDLVIIRKQHKSIMELCRMIDKKDSDIKDGYRFASAALGYFKADEADVVAINQRFDFMKWKSEFDHV